MTKQPIPLSDRVTASRDRAIDAGARKVTIMLPPDAAAALDLLQRNDYAASATACIAQALRDAAKRRK